MNILIAGASGFIGQELVSALEEKHNITVLGRNLITLQKSFKSAIKKIIWSELSTLDAHNYDAVINLSGYSIAASRWNEKIKKEIIDSRVNTTKTLINWVIAQKASPHFICANAVGIYGLQKNGSTDELTEESLINFDVPTDFLSEVGIKWQEATKLASENGIKVTTPRFGVVLKKGQGMLKKLELPFKFGLGSVIGDGKQVISWIHIEDLINAFLFILNHPELTGAFNFTAPNPVEQKEFSEILAKTLNRPLFLITPAFVIKMLFGQMGEELLLKGQRVVPKRLQDSGFSGFKYANLSAALQAEYK